MDCKRFEEWLAVREPSDKAGWQVASEHAADCPVCARLLDADDRLEAVLSKELCCEQAPERLRSSVALIAREPQPRSRPRRTWLVLPPAALAGLTLFLLVFNPFASEFTSIENIARLAEKNHHVGYTMQFHATEILDVAAWFRDRVPFEVVLPELAEKGYEFLGGRKCSIGRRDAAYLSYNKDGKRYSLFELDAADVRVEMVEAQTYLYPVGDCVVEIWKAGDRVFALVG